MASSYFQSLAYSAFASAISTWAQKRWYRKTGARPLRSS